MTYALGALAALGVAGAAVFLWMRSMRAEDGGDEQ